MCSVKPAGLSAPLFLGLDAGVGLGLGVGAGERAAVWAELKAGRGGVARVGPRIGW